MLACDAIGGCLTLYPLTFAPVFKSYTWGGRKLGSVLGRDIPDGRVAESWEVSAHPNGPTAVADGSLAGRSLAQLLAEYGTSLVGWRNRGAVGRGRFPLLIKFLDANEWLSVQVHPSDRHALEMEDDLGKTEMWVVLQADPGAELILGFEAATDRASLERAIAEDRLVDLLHRLTPRAGDVFFVPAGTIHALGPGLLLAEIQQNSDTTYRLHDWGRDPGGSPPRPLHVPQGLAATDLETVRPGAVIPEVHRRDGREVEVLASCRQFQTERLSLAAGESYAGRCDGETLELWCALSGGVEVHWSGEPIGCPAVHWVMLPAELGRFDLRAGGGSTLLRVFTPTPGADSQAGKPQIVTRQ